MPLELVEDDITTLRVDAIVNAANETLLGGGGVDGAIHRAAGRGLVDECRRLPESRPGSRCPTGEARITAGHDLPARHVIHTVGPVWHGGDRDEAAKLAGCYRNVFALVEQHGLRSVALPAISCGIYGYPIDEACAIAVREARAFLERKPEVRVVFCAFGDTVARAYRTALATDSPSSPPRRSPSPTQ